MQSQSKRQEKTYLGEATVVPEVALVGEAVADEANLALLDVLLDRVEELLLADLGFGQNKLHNPAGGH